MDVTVVLRQFLVLAMGTTGWHRGSADLRSIPGRITCAA